ncbi:MAG: SGNH/GDSL hydrolase family protein [Clostridiales bacterium]|nr:SGNH/GDSL hydrolase family protein [Clostridiales bacterium]
MTTVLCYGDSNTYGYDPKTGLRYSEDVRWPGVLSSLLGENYHVVEEGCNGRTTVTDDPVEGWKNGLDYLRPCLNSHKPVDIVVLMLGTNDLKEIFHLTAGEIADNAGILVDVIQSFTKEKQGFVPKIVLISPPEIGKDMPNSVFSQSFAPRSIEESKKFPKEYRRIADSRGCLFLNAAEFIYPSDADSLHLTEEGHRILAEKVAQIVRSIPV